MVAQKLIIFLTLTFLIEVASFGHCADCSPSRPCLPDRLPDVNYICALATITLVHVDN